MALNVSESNAVNQLIRYVLDEPGPTGRAVEGEAARKAAELLADKAHKTLYAGLTARDVAEEWPE